MSFSNYRIDWRMFNYFKPDFYKHFLNSTSSSEESSSPSTEPSPPSTETSLSSKEPSPPTSKKSVKTKCKKGTRRHKPMGPDCYSAEEISKWKNTQKVNKALNKTKKNT